MTSPDRLSASAVLLATASLAFGFASRATPVWAVACATIGILFVVRSNGETRTLASGGFRRIAGSILVGSGLITALSGRSAFFGDVEVDSFVWATIPAVLGLLIIVGGRRQFDRAVGQAALLIVLGVSIVSVVSDLGSGYGLDVYISHEAAADAVLAGSNPYTEAVTVFNGSPNADEGDVIVGYSYPPATMAPLVLADWLGGDPRVASAFAIGCVAIGVWWKRPSDLVGAAVLGSLAALPVLHLIVWSGWTEPMTLMYLAAGVWLWRRPNAAGVALGLALASKQYMVILVPLLMYVDAAPRRRTGVALLTATATFIPFAVSDFESLWFTQVARPLSLGFRPDSASLSGAAAQLGLSFEVPTIVAAGIALGVAALMIRSSKDRSADFPLAAVLALGVTFYLSLAFTNYWWLVQWIVAVAICSRSSDPDRRIKRSAFAPST